MCFRCAVRWQALSCADRGLWLYQPVLGDPRRAKGLMSWSGCCANAVPAQQDQGGQWAGVHLPRTRLSRFTLTGDAGLKQAGQVHRQCLRGVLQRPPVRQMLNAHWFLPSDDAKTKCEAWLTGVNESRCHATLGFMMRAQFALSAGANFDYHSGNRMHCLSSIISPPAGQRIALGARCP